MGYGAMSGIPMVASSPVRHDSPLNMQHGLEVTAYQPPWKALSDFALHADLDNNGAVNTHTPAFQHLVNQVSCAEWRGWSEESFGFEYDPNSWLIYNVPAIFFSLLIADARLRYEYGRWGWNAAPIAGTSTADAANGVGRAPPPRQYGLVRDLPGERRQHAGESMRGRRVGLH